MATHMEATVHAVTVFPDRARVTVRGRADLAGGHIGKQPLSRLALPANFSQQRIVVGVTCSQIALLKLQVVNLFAHRIPRVLQDRQTAAIRRSLEGVFSVPQLGLCRGPLFVQLFSLLREELQRPVRLAQA